jgi:CBS domain-containing protein
MRAVDVMVRGVVTVHPETSISDAITLLIEHDISALPVVDDEAKLVGVLSEADLIRRAELGTEKHRPWWMEAVTGAAALAEEFAKAHGQKVGDLMTTKVVSVGEDTPISDIATLLERHRIKRVPVIRDGKVIGVISRSNLIQALASTIAEQSENGAEDRAIRNELLDRLGHQDWTDFGGRNVIVTDAVVHLWGLVGSEAERHALVALAENVPGVKQVSDEMITP